MQMAKTTLFKNEVEPLVRDELKRIYPGHTFKETELRLGKRDDGTWATHKFDAVSEDKSIVGSIKSHSWKTSGGHLPAGKIGEMYQAIYFLSLVGAKQKLLILTDKGTYDGFVKAGNGKIAAGIDIKFCRLTPELQERVYAVQREASREMSHP